MKDTYGLTQIAINYGSRDEILRAVRRLAEDCVEGRLAPAQIDEAVFGVI